MLAVFSVLGGLAQLLVIRWEENRLGEARKELVLPIFLAYMVVVVWGVARLARTQRRLRQQQEGSE
jgi:hypothetical protein